MRSGERLILEDWVGTVAVVDATAYLWSVLCVCESFRSCRNENGKGVVFFGSS